MESEKVKEIKKGLEYGIENGKALGFNTKVLGIKAVDILTLINELECENERLNGKIKDMEFVGVGNCLSCDINEKGYKDMVKRVELEEQNEMLNKSIEKVNFALQQDHEDRERFRARNEELKDRIAELEKENGELLKENEGYHGSYRCAIDKIGELSAERYIKVEQFAEKVAKRLININGIKQILDETLKEFIDQ